MRTVSLSLLLTFLTVQGVPQDRTEQLASRVKSEFLHAWQGYKKYAWKHDAYKPLSKTAEDWYGTPFYLTAVEALDALMVMRLDEEADSTREFLATHLSFDKDVYVPVPDMASRVIGALLGSYQLSADSRLLALADSLGTRLLPAFISPTAMPYREINLKTGAVRGELLSPGDVGSLFLEFSTLGFITGKAAYFNHAKIALLEVYAHRSNLDLPGEEINISTGEWTRTDSHLESGIGEYYDALLKGSFLFDDADCKQMWLAHYAAINRYLLDSSAAGYWYGHADMNSGKRTRTCAGTRAAALPALQALFSDTGRAERTIQSLYALWRKFGAQPELYDYATGAVVKPACSLNPALFESVFTADRLIGGPAYTSMGEALLDSLILHCRTDEGYAELTDVTTKTKADRLDPWFFAGTMKYLYLLFTPPEVLDFGRMLMTTHGHPLRKVF